MRLATTALLTLVLAFTTAANPAYALEPDAPQQLISPEEAMVIMLRQRLDSTPKNLDKFARAERKEIGQFYTTGTNRLVWVDRNGLTSQARRAIVEIRNADEWGMQADTFELPGPDALGNSELSASQLVDLELKITAAIAKYARYARGGG
ncbi:MAG TPA: hypothetical protein VMX97_17840, partial [Hyphomicrobiaceae bacterium]|nr:hypothetical protein [Hyphomicrobiaceae bacterium]